MCPNTSNGNREILPLTERDGLLVCIGKPLNGARR
jgi:hypothetical protein